MKRRTFLYGAAGVGLGAAVNSASAKNWKRMAARDLKPISRRDEHVFAVGKNAMVSSDHPLATDAALWALKRGGNAADAYMVAALVQCVLEPTMTSLGGGFGLTFFNGGTGKLSFGGGSFGVPEALPLDIPYEEEKAWTGWSALVPGYVRGLEIVHNTYGKLRWEELFEPAIAFAEQGFVVDHFLWGYSFKARKILGRFPGAGRDNWFRNGHLIGVGETLRQPELAATLKMLQKEGPDSFYSGGFAKRFVDAVNRYGGALTLDDMQKIKGVATPEMTPGPESGAGEYRGYQLGMVGSGLNILMMRLIERADLRSLGHPTESADAMYIMVRIVQELWGLDVGRFSEDFFAASPMDQHRALFSEDMVEKVWKEIEHGKPKPFRGFAAGTCGLTVVDEQGNVAGGTHSTSSESYGSGIWVDGVIVNRPVFLRKYRNMPAGISTAQWVFKNGKPVFVMATPSRSFLECVMQATANTFEYRMNLEQSARAKRFGHPHPNMYGIEIEGDIDGKILRDLEKRGIHQYPVSPMDFNMGSIHALHFQEDGTVHGVADPRRAGMAKGY